MNNTRDAIPPFGAATGSASFPPVLDACCGSRMFWFDKQDDRAVFVDRRTETHELTDRTLVVSPDIVASFTELPFPNDAFALVVFDPPHHTICGTRFRSVKKPGWAMLKYGWLGEDWREVMECGFRECFRVLKPEGTLIFKWADKEIALSEILKLTPMKPLFGHKSGKQATTHWVAFLKPNEKLTDGGPP